MSAVMPGTEAFQDWMKTASDPAQIEQRIKELKVIKFWLEQNASMIDASINALDLQSKTVTLMKANPFLNGANPMEAVFNPLNWWFETVKKMVPPTSARAD